MAIQSKHVHFAHSHQVKLIEPLLDSDSDSDSDDNSSSSGPRTPPSLPFPLNSHNDDPKLPVVPHPILFNAHTNSSPLLWDVALPTHYATLSRPRPGKSQNTRELSHLHPMDLAMPATSPPLPSLTIHIPQLPPLWKPIQLRHHSSGSSGSSGSHATPITMGEVLEATHHHLQTRMSEREFNLAPEDMRRKIQVSVHRRLDVARRTGDRALVRALEHAGILRVDALGGATEFAAFLPTSNANANAATAAAAAADSWTIIFRPVNRDTQR